MSKHWGLLAKMLDECVKGDGSAEIIITAFISASYDMESQCRIGSAGGKPRCTVSIDYANREHGREIADNLSSLVSCDGERRFGVCDIDLFGFAAAGDHCG